ncbi:hypothetical protein FRX31_024086, partial [Thalictrum thalictroides]
AIIMDDDFKSVMIDWLEDEDDELRKHLVTQEEVQLLDPKYYYDCGYIHRSTRKNVCLDGNPITNISYPMAFIRKAYINLKLRKEETHILEVLKDKPFDSNLLHSQFQEHEGVHCWCA